MNNQNSRLKLYFVKKLSLNSKETDRKVIIRFLNCKDNDLELDKIFSRYLLV